MGRTAKKIFGRRLVAALVLLAILALLLPLSGYLAGILPGGDSGGTPVAGDRLPAAERGDLQVTILRGETRSPVVGAEIVVRGLEGGAARAVQSDQRGQASLEGLGEGPVHVTARHDGLSAAGWHDPAAEGRIEVAVDPRPVLTGVVRRADGSPVEATVRLVSGDGSELASVSTGPGGRYELPNDRRAASLCAEPKEGSPAAAVSGDLVIESGKEHVGRLLDAGAGKLEVFAAVSTDGEDRPLLVRATWDVAADGTFRGRLPEGARAWALFGKRPFLLREGDVTLPELVELRGIVVRPDGSPVVGARLVFDALLGEDFPPPLPAREVATGTDGTFRAKDFAAMRYSVRISGPGCANRIVHEVTVAREQLRFVLDLGFAVTGSVVDGSGLPVPDARIQAIGLPDDEGERPVLETNADDDGRFDLAGLGGDWARLRVTARGYHPATLDKVVPDQKLRVALQRR